MKKVTDERLEKELKLSEEIEMGRVNELVPVLQKLPTIEVAEILSELSEGKLLEVLSMLTREQQAQVFSDFDFDLQYLLFDRLDRWQFASIFEWVPSEIRADFFQEISREEQIQLLPYLVKSVRKDVIELSKYPPETAGGIMSTDFATVIETMTTNEAIAKVRADAPSQKMIYYIYVVDEDMMMRGFVTLKDLILAEPNQMVSEILHSEYVYAEVEEDRETVAQKVEKYDLVAIPVLNNKRQLVGIVTHDEAIEVIRAEQTEDMEKFMGIVPDGEDVDYLGTTFWQHFKKRAAWLVSLAALGIVSGFIIHRYETTLEEMIILALFIPMLADAGGNSGSQAATVVIRALSLGQLKVGDWLKIIWKECRIAVFLGLALGILAYGKVLVLSHGTELPGDYGLPYVAFVIAIAISIQVLTATVIGAVFPLFVKAMGGDPAVAASPAITTVVDVTGLLLYFGIAILMLGL